VDDQIFATYSDRQPGWPLAFSADGSVVAHRLWQVKGKRCRVVVNGREGPEFDGVGQPFLSADGAVVAYRAERNDEYFIRVGDRDGPAFEFVTDPAVSADGSTVAYAASQEGRWFLVAGARKIPLAGHPDMVFVSPDGRQVGWVDRESLPEGGYKMRVAVPGRVGETFSIVGRPAFSPSGATFAYAADEGARRFVVIGPRKVETPHRVSDPVFSPDGRHVGYGARIGRELWWRVVETDSNH